ncbi:MAG: ATP-binding protein [Actinomycetota bacterium]
MSRGRSRFGLRVRITVAFLGGALAVSAIVAGTTYVLADRYLRNQRIEDSTAQTISSIAFSRRYLSRPEAEVSLAELTGLLEARGAFEALVLEEGQWFSSSVSVTPETVPFDLAGAVEEGRVGYVYRDTPRQIVFGSPVPGYGLTAFFFYPTADIAETLGVLRQVLIGVSVGAVLLAATVGTRVSRRVVDPVRRVSQAARRVAEGLLETRLPSGGQDELGALADSFNEMAAALEKRIAHERRFVGDVSHELRTPLTTLRASTDYLRKRSDDLSPPLRRAAELLAADLEYLQRLVDDLLDISRAEAGPIEMSWERVNLAELTREVVSRRLRAGGEQVRVLVEGDTDDLSTVADKQRLERVVGNLVDNAIVHGGRDVSVHVGAQDGVLRVGVEDRGPGIPTNALGRIFERFFKADPARRRGEGRGSGLGLAIARENAHLHGGEIEVASRPGQGARFTFRFPRRQEEPGP